MTKDEALDLALEALQFDGFMPEDLTHRSLHAKAITAIKQARALDKMAENARELGLDYEPDQVPIGYLCENAVGHKYFRWKKPSSVYKPIPLYTSPQLPKETEK